jgi:FAD/FMN-containing dehydrogenase/Fe-S oxidoreductase
MMARELAGRIRGEVREDDLTRRLYATAACIFSITPKAVVTPKTADDVSVVVRYAAERGTPVTARGAGSGLAGQTLGDGIILDCSRHLDRIIEVDQKAMTALAEPGVVLGDLNRRLKQYGLWFPPDPSSGDVATLGGMIANNAAGAHTVKYGATREYVEAIEVVLDDGSRCWTDKPNARLLQLIAATSSLLAAKRDVAAANKPDVVKNSSGYHVWDDPFRVERLLVGSEGTLAIVTAARLRIIRAPGEKALLRIYYDDVEKACEAVVRLKALNPAALELLDKTLIDLVRENVSLPAGLKTVLLCEFDGDLGVVEKARELVPDAIEIKVATGADFSSLWKIRKAASPILDRMEGPLRSTRIVEDAAVNPSRLPEYIRGLKEIFARHGTDGVIFGHAGSGHIHCNLLMQPHADQEKIAAICGDVADLVARLKGTLSGEHGDGILRAAYLHRTYGPLVDVFAELKRLWDPKGILNPGKKVAPADFDFRKHLRPSRRPDTGYVDSPAAGWTRQIEKCNGCGTCRTYCPVHLERHDEASTPRAKANAMTGVLQGMPVDAALRSVVDLCINCKLCWDLCPAGVDIPGMCLEAKAIDTQARGLSSRDEKFVHVRDHAGTMANLGLAIPGVKAAMGLAPRAFPKFVKSDVKPTKKSDRKVAYFAGCHADLYDPDEKRATIEVLERNGFEVVLPAVVCCGMPAQSLGARMEAVDAALANTNALLGLDMPVVTSAPSCGLMIREEYPGLLRGLDRVAELSARTYDIHEFLWKLHLEGKLDEKFLRVPASVLFHPPCHLRAMGAAKAAKELLKLIPEVQLVEAPEYCCGQAGSFGFKRENHELSQAIARHAVEEYRRRNPTFLVTSNGTCRHQLEENLGRAMMHSIVLIHKAYGMGAFQGVHAIPEAVALRNLADGMKH